MKRIVILACILCILCGCSHSTQDMKQGLLLRENLLSGNGCEFLVKITADYASEFYTFSMKCSVDQSGTLTFTVCEPESISDISGTVGDQGGTLRFLEQILAFPLLAEGQISPISGPWLLLQSIRGGYIQSACEEEGQVHITYDDSFRGETLRVDAWLLQDGMPVRGEIAYKNKRILTMEISQFTFL